MIGLMGAREAGRVDVDVLHRAARDRLAAVLDLPSESDVSFPAAHWLLFAPTARQDTLGADGHPPIDEAIPAVPGARRMWASSDVVIHAALPVGSPVQRSTDVAEVRTTNGRSGELTFVTLAHQYAHAGNDIVEERQTLVYRAPVRDEVIAPREAAPPMATGDPVPTTWSRRVQASNSLVFRWCALTFNAHRIHYDLAYAREVEGYPGLVVPGPLVATLLLELHRTHATRERVTGFRFRACSPLFVGSSIELRGAPSDGGAHLVALGPDGGIAAVVDVRTSGEVRR